MPNANATVTIKIKKFDGAFVSPETPPTMMVPFNIASSSGRAVVTPPSGEGSEQGGGGPYKPGSIKVDGRGTLDLKFHVVDNEASPGRYIVCGLLFSEIASVVKLDGLPKKTGRDIYTEFTCDEYGDLTVQNVKKGDANFHFLLLIQNMKGGVGIIDPLISNQ